MEKKIKTLGNGGETRKHTIQMKLQPHWTAGCTPESKPPDLLGGALPGSGVATFTDEALLPLTGSQITQDRHLSDWLEIKR